MAALRTLVVESATRASDTVSDRPHGARRYSPVRPRTEAAALLSVMPLVDNSRNSDSIPHSLPLLGLLPPSASKSLNASPVAVRAGTRRSPVLPPVDKARLGSGGSVRPLDPSLPRNRRS